jgi:DNA-binding response OmpR family regulator
MSFARLLIATCNADVLDTLQGALSQDYLIASAAHAEELPAAVEALRPDLVLLDWRLPGADAAAVCAYLERGAGVPVIAVLAEAGPADEAAVYAAGAVDYVLTPVLQPALRARVHLHLMLRRPTTPEAVWHDAMALLGGSTALQAALPY